MYRLTLLASLAVLTLSNPALSETWATGCLTARGSIVNLNEGRSVPKGPCAGGAANQVSLMLVPKGVKFGKRDHTLTGPGEHLLFNSRAVRVWLVWTDQYNGEVCQLLFQEGAQQGRTDFGGVGNAKGFPPPDRKVREAANLYVYNGQAVQLYDMVTAWDADGCYAALRFQRANAPRGSNGAMAAVKVLYRN